MFFFITNNLRRQQARGYSCCIMKYDGLVNALRIYSQCLKKSLKIPSPQFTFSDDTSHFVKLDQFYQYIMVLSYVELENDLAVPQLIFKKFDFLRNQMLKTHNLRNHKYC